MPSAPGFFLRIFLADASARSPSSISIHLSYLKIRRLIFCLMIRQSDPSPLSVIQFPAETPRKAPPSLIGGIWQNWQLLQLRVNERADSMAGGRSCSRHLQNPAAGDQVTLIRAVRTVVQPVDDAAPPHHIRQNSPTHSCWRWLPGNHVSGPPSFLSVKCASPRQRHGCVGVSSYGGNRMILRTSSEGRQFSPFSLSVVPTGPINKSRSMYRIT